MCMQLFGERLVKFFHARTPLCVALCVSLMLLIGCRRNQPPPTPTPSPTVTPTAIPVSSDANGATPLPPAASALRDLTADQNEFTNERVGYTIQLPTAWHAAAVDGANVGALLQQIAHDPDAAEFAQIIKGFADAGGAAHLDLLAYQAVTAEMPITLSTVTPPRNGLTIDAYLAAVREQLDDVEIEHTGLDDTLRPDGMPAGIVQFRTEDDLSYYQTIFFNGNAEYFIIMTFAAPSELLPDLLSTFRALVAAVDLP